MEYSLDSDEDLKLIEDILLKVCPIISEDRPFKDVLIIINKIFVSLLFNDNEAYVGSSDVRNSIRDMTYEFFERIINEGYSLCDMNSNDMVSMINRQKETRPYVSDELDEAISRIKHSLDKEN